MLSVIFKAKKSGEGMISAGEFKILKNDGIGTSASIKISTLGFMVLKSNGQIFESNLNIPKDADLPETFNPDIAINLLERYWQSSYRDYIGCPNFPNVVSRKFFLDLMGFAILLLTFFRRQLFFLVIQGKVSKNFP